MNENNDDVSDNKGNHGDRHASLLPRNRVVLSDRQSARTTFKLSTRTYEILEQLAKWEGVSEKDVIDAYASLLFEHMRDSDFVDGVLRLAREPIPGTSTRKSRVVTKGTLRKLLKMSKRHSISRDALMELIVRYAHSSILLRCKEMLKKLQTGKSKIDKEIIPHYCQAMHEANQDLEGTEYHFEEDLEYILDEVMSAGAFTDLKHETERYEECLDMCECYPLTEFPTPQPLDGSKMSEEELLDL